MYKERKVIVIDCCETCPFYGKCKPWKNLTSAQRVRLTIGHGSGKSILNDCPLPYGEDNAEPFSGLTG